MMDVEVVTLLKVPVKILCFGGVTPSGIVKSPEFKPKEMILVIPGNPGLLEFLHEFGTRLYEKTKLPIWVIAQGGHGDLPVPPLSRHPDLYNLQGQTRQKKELIDTYLRGVKLRCVAHSIGCKMLLDILKSGEPYASQIDSAYCLFPTIEKMAESPNGKRFIFLYTYFYWPFMAYVFFVNSIPHCFKKLIIFAHLYYEGVTSQLWLEGFLRFSDMRVLRKVLYLANDEMKNVLSRDDDVISKFVDRIRFFYSSIDTWAPREYFIDLKKKFPDVKAEYDCSGISHAFVLKFSVTMADKVAEWLQIDQEETSLKTFDKI